MEDLFRALSGNTRHPDHCSCMDCQEKEREAYMLRAHHRRNAMRITNYFKQINDPRSKNITPGSWVVCKPGHASTAVQERLEPVFVLEMFEETRVPPLEPDGFNNLTYEPVNMRVAVGMFSNEHEGNMVPSSLPCHTRNYLLWTDVGGELDKDGYPIVPRSFIPDFGYKD